MGAVTLPYCWDAVKKDQINDLMKRQTIHGEVMTVARMEMTTGCVVAPHSHHNEQISTVEKGLVKFTVDGKEVILKPGEVLHILPNLVHSAQALEDSVAVEFFSPRREDWIRGDSSYTQKK
jgi:quercetin dioxygenase-like cupin family protein